MLHTPDRPLLGVRLDFRLDNSDEPVNVSLLHVTVLTEFTDTATREKLQVVETGLSPEQPERRSAFLAHEAFVAVGVWHDCRSEVGCCVRAISRLLINATSLFDHAGGESGVADLQSLPLHVVFDRKVHVEGTLDVAFYMFGRSDVFRVAEAALVVHCDVNLADDTDIVVQGLK